jgi:hypothetical protein
MEGIVFQRLADRQLFLLCDGGKVIAHGLIASSSMTG